MHKPSSGINEMQQLEGKNKDTILVYMTQYSANALK